MRSAVCADPHDFSLCSRGKNHCFPPKKHLHLKQNPKTIGAALISAIFHHESKGGSSMATAKKAAKKKPAAKKPAAKKAVKKTVAKKAPAKKVAAKKPAAKKVAAKKAPAKKAVAKKAVAKKAVKKAKTTRKPNAAFMKPMTPSAVLAAVIGSSPMPRTDVTKKVWDYIKKHKLQDPVNKRNINADDKLKAVFNGKKTVSMFEMTKLISGHLK
jgi:chromatin remodeling complex protein RSC6